MLIDNESTKYKYYEILEKYAKEGVIQSVSGYFTVGILSYFKQLYNNSIKEYHFILGDIVSSEGVKERTIDLINENISIDNGFECSQTALYAIEFLRQEKVQIKTLEPNFCHAKVFIFKSYNHDEQKDYYILGSSNLTETGIGLRKTSNAELNVLGQGSAAEYNELTIWFKNLWENKKALYYKTVNNQKINFKDYLIELISTIYKKYTPKDIYYKILYELFGNDLQKEAQDPNFNRQIGRLENTLIYKSLYDFQKKAVKSLIKMIDKYDGAILADAVGLGKTWTALAVIKHYQLLNYDVIVLCPKKLEQNWQKFLKNRYSIFEDDKFDYVLRFHSDLREGGLDKDRITLHDFFQSERQKLLVIDESHNLRNDKSQRYKYLVDNILQKNEVIKVLMLSATPINNSLNDVRNQFKLICKASDSGFKETLDINSIYHLFRNANFAFSEWKKEENPTITSFIARLKESDFFKLTDALTVSRTRKMIEGFDTNFVFPIKNAPENQYVTPNIIGNFESFEELFAQFPPMLSAYQPTFYLEEQKNVEVIYNEQLRDRFLVKMIYILLVKRLESSWFSFYSTINKIQNYHQDVLNKLNNYKLRKDELISNFVDLEVYTDETEDDFSDLTLGKRAIKIVDIDRAGKLEAFKSDLKTDIQYLDILKNNLERFNQKISKETEKQHNTASSDSKLQILIAKIIDKQKSGKNNGNKKVIMFTVFKDTAEYLFNQLKLRGLTNIAYISGTESKVWDSETSTKNFDSILERFAPFTKLFKEKTWNNFTIDKSKNEGEQFADWKKWIMENMPETQKVLMQPIDILIATDCLSEGQNLQDCDYIVNYDIHWNPVRVIQRLGRIDRLGSPNSEIFGLNFWPSSNINEYLKLQSRIEDRMIMMKLAGAEVDNNFTEKLKTKIADEKFDEDQTNKMLEKLEKTYQDVETSDNSISFDVLSLETFRQDLSAEMEKNISELVKMPKAIYSGIIKTNQFLNEKGLVSLIGYPSKPAGIQNFNYTSFDLIYLDKKGNQILNNQKEILNGLLMAKEQERNNLALSEIDKGNKIEIDKLKNAIKTWLQKQTMQTIENENGEQKEIMGEANINLFNKLKKGKSQAKLQLNQSITHNDKYNSNNCDLIAWLLVD